MSTGHVHRRGGHNAVTASAVGSGPDAAIDSPDFRRVMSQYVTGVTVVTSALSSPESTAEASEIPVLSDMHGMTCNSFASVSSSNGSISVCLTQSTRTARLILKTGMFAVNILAADQIEIAHRFAGRHKEHESDRFQGIAWKTGLAVPVPLLIDAKAILECRLMQAIDCGDHILCIARVVASSFHGETDPLIFYSSRLTGLTLTGEAP